MVDQPGGAGLEGGHDAWVEVPGVSSDDVDKKTFAKVVQTWSEQEGGGSTGPRCSRTPTSPRACTQVHLLDESVFILIQKHGREISARSSKIS